MKEKKKSGKTNDVINKKKKKHIRGIEKGIGKLKKVMFIVWRTYGF
jgi:hypothetical protein